MIHRLVTLRYNETIQGIMVFNKSKKNSINRFNDFEKIYVLNKIDVDYTPTIGNCSNAYNNI